MKSRLIALLFLLNLFTHVKASSTQQLFFKKDTTILEVPSSICNQLLTLRNPIDDLGDNKDKPIPLDHCSLKTFSLLVEYMQTLPSGSNSLQDNVAAEPPFATGTDLADNPFTAIMIPPRARHDFLQSIHNRIPELIGAADYLNIDDTTDLYTDLMEYTLAYFNAKELAHYITRFDRTATKKALKKMQLAAVIKDKHGPDKTRRSLEHPKNLGKAKIALLKKHTFYPIQISIQDIFDNETTHHLLIPGQDSINLSHCCITSLEGLKNLSNREHIKKLTLSHNKITEIPDNIFEGFSQLEWDLNLENNQIIHINSKSFTHLSRLKFLNLDNNPLQKVELEAFRDLKKLQCIDLRLHNEMWDMPISLLLAMTGITLFVFFPMFLLGSFIHGFSNDLIITGIALVPLYLLSSFFTKWLNQEIKIMKMVRQSIPKDCTLSLNTFHIINRE